MNSGIRFDESRKLQFIQSAHLQRNVARLLQAGSAHVYGLQPWVGFHALNQITRGPFSKRWRTATLRIAQTWYKNESLTPGADVPWETGWIECVCRINPKFGDYDYNSVTTSKNGLVWEYQAAEPCGYDSIYQREFYWGAVGSSDPYRDRDLFMLTGSGPTFYEVPWVVGVPPIDLDDPAYVDPSVIYMNRDCDDCSETRLHFIRTPTTGNDVSGAGYGIVSQEWTLTLADEIKRSESEVYGLELFSSFPLSPYNRSIKVDFGGNDVRSRVFGPGAPSNLVQINNRRSNPRIQLGTNSFITPPVVEAPCLEKNTLVTFPDYFPSDYILPDDCFPDESKLVRQYPAWFYWSKDNAGPESFYTAADHTGYEGPPYFLNAPLPSYPNTALPDIKMGSQGVNSDALRMKKSIYVPSYLCFGNAWATEIDGAKNQEFDTDMNSDGSEVCAPCAKHGEIGPWAGVVKFYPTSGDNQQNCSHAVEIPTDYGRLRRSVPGELVDCVDATP